MPFESYLCELSQISEVNLASANREELHDDQHGETKKTRKREIVGKLATYLTSSISTAAKQTVKASISAVTTTKESI